jgi:hypothetical protein
VRTAALRQSLLARLGSPLALLAAAGVGFALDRSRVLRWPRPAGAGVAARPRAGLSLAMIMQTLGLAGALIDLLRVSARPPAGHECNGAGSVAADGVINPPLKGML